jgi:hypothetical protein
LSDNLTKLKKTVEQYVEEFNSTFILKTLDSEQEVRNSYTDEFFQSMSDTKEMPLFIYCLWFNYLLEKKLRTSEFDTGILVQKIFDNGEIKLHFILKVTIDDESHYLDLIGENIYMSQRTDLIKVLKNEKNGFELLGYYEMKNTQDFVPELLRAMKKEFLSDWSLEKTIQNLVNVYERIGQHIQKPALKFIENGVFS